MMMMSGHLWFYVREKYAPLTKLPTSALEAPWGMDWFIHMVPVNYDIYMGLLILGIVLSFLSAIGLFTRFVLPINTLVLFYVLGIPLFYGKIYHYHFMFWVPLILSFSRCSDSFSIDSLFKKNQPNGSQKHQIYGIPINIIFIQLGIIYFFSAIGKLWLTGFKWALSDNIVNLMRLEWFEHYAETPFLRLDNFPVLCSILGISVILFELFYLFLILFPKTRKYAALSAIAFHISNDYFLKIGFEYLQYLNSFHLDWNEILNRLRSQLSQLKKIGFTIGLIIVLFLWSELMLISLSFLFTYQLFKKHSTAFKNEKSSPFFWVICTILLSGNLLFSLGQINSWPFTAYPSYSFIRKAEIKYVEFDIRNADNSKINLDSLFKEKHISKESLLPISENLVELYSKGKEGEFKISVLNYWLRLRELIPEISSAKSCQVLIREYSINPDSLQIPNSELVLGEIHNIRNESYFQFKNPGEGELED